MSFGETLGKHLTMAASANIFFIAIDYKNKANIKVAANTNIKSHQVLFKQRILYARVTIAQWKILGHLT